MVVREGAYYTKHVISNLKGMYVILTNGSKRIANIASISKVEAVNINDLILRITGNVKTDSDGMYIKIGNLYYRLTFDIIQVNISKILLESYMLCYEDKLDFKHDLFQYSRFNNKVKYVRSSNTGGVFLDWYNGSRKTAYRISSFDGIWLSGNYIRTLPLQPPNLEFNISETLFELFNDSKLITSIGSYKYYDMVDNKEFLFDKFDEYVTINGIVIPNIKSYKFVSNEKIVAIDEEDNEFIIYSNKKEETEYIA